METFRERCKRRSEQRREERNLKKVAEIKQMCSSLGRLRKREKQLRKDYKVVTLTEIFGKPWRILVRKSSNKNTDGPFV